MKVVTPFRPFVPESPAHKRLGPFDWLGAIQMLRASVRSACACDTYVLSDVDTDLKLPSSEAVFTLLFTTVERRLMLWLLEVWLAYLDSPFFDDDTVMISPDALVYQDLRPFFRADLGVIVRTAPKFEDRRPLLNGAQFWRVEAKARLVPFYRQALAIAKDLPQDVIRWGADTESLLALLAPVHAGIFTRAGLTVCGLSRDQVFQGLTTAEERCLEFGRPLAWPTAAITDFKYTSKWLMQKYYTATYGAQVPA